MSDDSFDSLEELPARPAYDDDDEDSRPVPKMGRNTTADLEDLLKGFESERFSGAKGGRVSLGGGGGGLDYAQLDAYLDEPSSSSSRFSEKPRGSIQSFVDAMDFYDEDEGEEVEVEVKPKNSKQSSRPSQAAQNSRPSQAAQNARPSQAAHNSRPSQATTQQSRPSQKQSQPQVGKAKHVNPVPEVGTNARLGPTYPAYAGTPVSDARRPKREKAIAAPDAKAPDVFLVEKPEDHLESSVYFSGTVSFNDPQAADRFLALLTQLVNQSAIVFHEIRNDNPGAARSLAGVIREMRGMLHHFVDSAEEETAKQMCLDSIRVVEQEAQEALNVLDNPPAKRGDMWAMSDNQHLADSLKRVLSECCLLMKVSEREQAQQFMVVVKTCFDTVENILNSHKRHCAIYFTHLQGYMSEHLYPLLDNRIETTPDAELKDQYRKVRTQLHQTHPAFKAFMDGQWPASAPERAKSAASYDSKREGALPFIEALQTLEDILKTLLNPVSDFEIRFNMPRKPLEDIAQKLIRASARQDRPAVVEAAKELQAELKQLPQEDPLVEEMRISGRDLIQHSKKVLAKEEMPEQMAVVAEKLLSQAAQMEEEQSSRRRSGPGQDVVEAMARASQRMALIAADPMRVSTAHPQVAVRASKHDKEPLNVQQMRVSESLPQHVVAVDAEVVRKSAARVSSRASVVVQLAKVRNKGKPKAREQLVEASDRVAKALEQLAELESAPDADLAELERLVELVDEQQAGLFDQLPPAPSKRSEDVRASVRKSMQRGTTVVQLYEKQKGDRRPNEKLVVAAEKVAQTLEELTALKDDATVGDDELALLADESARQQRELLVLAKDPSNFQDDEFFNEF